MTVYMNAVKPQYDESCYQQWKLLEDELNKKPMDRKIQKNQGSKFSLVLKESHELSERLKGDGVSQAVYMTKMAEKTAALAEIVRSAQVAQVQFERDQLLLAGKEGFCSKCTLDGAFKASESLAEIVAMATGGGFAGGAIGRVAAVVPSPVPKAVGIMVGLVAGLVIQAAKASEKGDKK